MARAVRGSDPVVMHDALYATSILAMVAAKIYRKRTVLVQHIASVPFSSRILRFAMALANLLVTRPMLRAADARVFISDTVRGGLLGTPARHPYSLLFNGVDRSIFHPSPDFDRRWGLSGARTPRSVRWPVRREKGTVGDPRAGDLAARYRDIAGGRRLDQARRLGTWQCS